MTIAQVYIMTNGNVAVFDSTGQQMPEMQGPYTIRKQKLFDAIKEQDYMPVFFDQRAMGKFLDSMVQESIDEAMRPK
jgi:hypothetical protein